MRPCSRRRFLALAAAGLTLPAAGCAASRTRDGTVAPGVRADTAAAPSAGSAATPGTLARLTDRVYRYDLGGLPDSVAGRIRALNGADGTRDRELPLGAAVPDWSALYAVQSVPAATGPTTLRALDPRTGQVLRETALDGVLVLPPSGINAVPGGLSSNGRWLALETPRAGSTRALSRFVVVDAAFAGRPKPLELDGDYAVDCVSDDGAWLYLIENLQSPGPGTYHVRRYDVAHGQLDPTIVADKARLETTMRGLRLSGVPSRAGNRLFSLYVDGERHPFVHALDLPAAIAVCIDLPTGTADFEKQLLWSMALSSDGRSLYAVNAAFGLAIDIDTYQLRIRRRGTFTPARRRSFNPVTAVLDRFAASAEAKRLVANGAVLSPDGATLFVLDQLGVTVLRTADLSRRAHHLDTWMLDSLALSPDGNRLYALSTDRGRIACIDSATGDLLSDLPDSRHAGGLLRVGAAI